MTSTSQMLVQFSTVNAKMTNDGTVCSYFTNFVLLQMMQCEFELNLHYYGTPAVDQSSWTVGLKMPLNLLM